MQKRVRSFVQSTLILLTLGISVQVSAQPEVVTRVPFNSENFITIGDLVYFTAGEELWRTDGTAAGTMALQTGFNQGHLWSTPAFGSEFKGDFYFVNDNRELWKSDGTASGTIRLHTSDANYLRIYEQTNDYLFFGAHDDITGVELYRTDGTPGGTMLVKDINPGGANGPNAFFGYASVGNYLFFPADNGSAGQELWKSDGSEAGTVMVKDINPGPADGFLDPEPSVFVSNDIFYFAGNTPESGTEPWVSNGTFEGTYQLQEIVPGAESAGRLTYEIAHNGVVYFLAYNVDAIETTELWRTSGTTLSTSKIEALGDDTDYHSFLVYEDKISFFNFGEFGVDRERLLHKLWVSDGTTEGTQEIFYLDADNSIDYFDVVNGYMLFSGSATDEGYPTNFYRSDGTMGSTPAGNQPFAEFKSAHSPPARRDLTTVGDFTFYADHDGPVDAGSIPDNEADYFHLFQADGFTSQSMRTLYGVSTVGAGDITDFNGIALFTTYDDQTATGEPKDLWIYDPANPSQTRASFTLVNAATDEDMQTINEGDVINKPKGTYINIRYNPVETPGSVTFSFNGTAFRTETAPPYALAGDLGGDYNPWQGANPGTYQLTATPYSEAGGKGTAGEALTVTFTIEEQPATEVCTASGTILWEYWNWVEGNSVSNIPVNHLPHRNEEFTIFEGPTNFGTNYGSRLRGYVCPPSTGNYTFWIASNDHSELWLSTDDQPTNKVKIAYVTGATSPREWSKFQSQKSVPVTLTAGKRYYIEALHKQGVGTDNIAVGWQLPEGTMERPIPGNRLSPFLLDNQPPRVLLEYPNEGQSFNPPATIPIEARASDDEGHLVKVEFFEGANKLGEDDTHPYTFTWSGMPPGSYTLTAKAVDNKGATTTSHPVNITVNEGTGECTATGTITREYWSGVSGDRVSNIPVHTAPTSTSELTIFEGPSNIGTNYGTRIRGYLCPPVTSGYNFMISSNDHGELWLSTDENPANKVRIAYVEGATDPRQWAKYASQHSRTIWLEAGQKYYIEALHKQGVGTDHIAVGWQWGDGTLERPIPGIRLSPFEMNAQTMAFGDDQMTSSGDAALYSQISVYPNPAQSGDAELSISGYDGIKEAIETEVEIINLTGEVVYSERFRCGGDCNAYLMNINQQLVPGVYMVNMKTSGTRSSRRLLVK